MKKNFLGHSVVFNNLCVTELLYKRNITLTGMQLAHLYISKAMSVILLILYINKTGLFD